MVICLSVKMGFEAAAEDEDEEAASLEAAAPPPAEEADMAAEAARITEASSIIGSGEDGGEDLSPEEQKEISKIPVLFPKGSRDKPCRREIYTCGDSAWTHKPHCLANHDYRI